MDERLAGGSIGERVRALREKARWSQRMLAARAGVSHSYVNLLEKGEVPRPGIERLSKIAAVFDMTVEELLGERPARSIREEPAQYTADPRLQEIQVNLKTIKELNDRALADLDKIMLEAREKEERGAEQ